MFMDRPKIIFDFAAAVNESRLRQCVSLRQVLVGEYAGHGVPAKA